MLYKNLNDVYTKNKNILIPFANLYLENTEIENNCFDCGRRNPEFISINNGIFICKICGITHMTFPTGTSILINNDQKSLSERELKFLNYGGNKRLYEYILVHCPFLINLPKIFLYTSRFLNNYRNILLNLVKDENESYINKMKTFQNKLNNLQINTNSNCLLYDDNNYEISNNLNNYINKRFNTINFQNNINENELKEKNILNNNNKEKYSDEDKNKYILTQRTIENHNNNKFNHHTNTDKKNKLYLKKSNIIYNKPKLKNIINKLKIDKKENNEDNKTCRNNFSKELFTSYFDEIKQKVKNDVKDINNKLRTSTPSDKFKTPLKTNKYSSKTLLDEKKVVNNIDIKHISINKEKIFKKISPTIFIKNLNSKKNKRNNTSKNISDSTNDKNEYSNTTKSGRRIREIIINKTLNKNFSYNNNFYQFNTKAFIEQRRPIQVNLSLQNTIDNSQNNNNNYKINSCITDFDYNEDPKIIIHNSNKNLNVYKNNDTKSVKNWETSTKYKINGVHIKLNKNLKTKKEKAENEEVLRTKSEKKIKTININFIKNMKNKTLNDDEQLNDKYHKTIVDSNTQKNNDPNIFDKDDKNKKESIKIENAFQFQILPFRMFKKIYPKKIKNKSLNYMNENENNNYNNKKENSILYKCKKDNFSITDEKRKIISPKRKEMNYEAKSENMKKNDFIYFKEKKNNQSNSYKKIELSKIGETFKNSIRNRYKREKSSKEIEQIK